MTDETPWTAARYAEELRRVVLERDQLRQQLATVEVLDLARVALKPGDTLLVRPKECADIVTAEQADEWTEYLCAVLVPLYPGVRVLVLPVPSDMAVISGDGADG